MRRYNVNEPEFADDETDPDSYKTAYERIAPKVGGDKLGATHYLIRPGQHLCHTIVRRSAGVDYWEGER